MLRAVLNSLSGWCGLTGYLYSSSTGKRRVGVIGGDLLAFYALLSGRFYDVCSTALRPSFTDSSGVLGTVSTGPTTLTTIFNKFRSSGGERIFQ